MSLLTEASLIVTPNAYNVGKLYSVIPNTTLGDMDVVRATSATRVNSAGLIESVAINVPRLDYPPLGGCPSILVEPARTNNVLYSEQFDNGLWNKSNVTVTPNTTISPDGTTTADNVNITTTNGFLRRTSLTFANSTSYTISIFVKKSATTGTKNFRFYYTNGVNSGLACTVDLTNITATTTTNGIIPPTILSTKLVNYSNNWYRVEVAFTTSALGGNSTSEIGLQPLGGGPVVDFDAWGAQLEEGANATSYIPTTTAAVPRAADVISKTGITTLIGQTEGTLFVDVNFEAESIAKYYLTLGTSSAFNIAISAKTNNKIGMEVWNSSSQVNASSTSTYTTNQRLKIAMTYKVNDFNLYVNGVLQATDTGGTVPATGAVILGSTTASLFQATDGINLAILWKTPLTDDQCILLTGPSFSSYPEMASALIYTLQ